MPWFHRFSTPISDSARKQTNLCDPHWESQLSSDQFTINLTDSRKLETSRIAHLKSRMIHRSYWSVTRNTCTNRINGNCGKLGMQLSQTCLIRWLTFSPSVGSDKIQYTTTGTAQLSRSRSIQMLTTFSQEPNAWPQISDSVSSIAHKSSFEPFAWL